MLRMPSVLSPPGTRAEDEIDRYVALKSKEDRTEEEEVELKELTVSLQEALLDGETELEREAEKVVDEALERVLQNVSPELLDDEAREQLKEIFS